MTEVHSSTAIETLALSHNLLEVFGRKVAVGIGFAGSATGTVGHILFGVCLIIAALSSRHLFGIGLSVTAIIGCLLFGVPLLPETHIGRISFGVFLSPATVIACSAQSLGAMRFFLATIKTGYQFVHTVIILCLGCCVKGGAF